MASKQKSTAALVATVIVAVIAAVAVFISVYLAAQTKQEEVEFQQEVIEEYVPDTSLSDEMKDAAARLIKENYKVIKLFRLRGLPHLEEPYGNAPEDGLYTVDIENSDYKSLEEINALVEGVYTPETVEKVIGDDSPFLLRGDELGIKADFKPEDESYNIDWTGSIDFKVEPDSATECKIFITVSGKDGGKVEKETSMIKLNDVWYLEDVIY